VTRIAVDVEELEALARQYERSAVELAGITLDLRQRLGTDLLDRVRAYGLPTRSAAYDAERICAALTAHVGELERSTLELERVWAEASGLVREGRLVSSAVTPNLWWFRVAGSPASVDPGSQAFAAASATGAASLLDPLDPLAVLEPAAPGTVEATVLKTGSTRGAELPGAAPGTWEEIDRYLLSLGIAINSPPEDWQTTGGRHSPTSYHYRSRARDYCVDVETEILTARGWRRYDELIEGEDVLTLHLSRLASEWQPLQAVHVFPPERRRMLRLEGNIHSSLTTAGHRWAVETLRSRTASTWTHPRGLGGDPRGRTHCPRGHPYDEFNTHITASGRRRCRACDRERMRSSNQLSRTERRFVTSADLTHADRIPIAAPCAGLPTERKYSDALVELVAWVWTEGWVSPTGAIGIGQSHTVNPRNVDRIRAALYETFGPPSERPMRARPTTPHWRETVAPGPTAPLTVFRLNRLASAPITVHLALPEKVPEPTFLRSLTEAQLHLFIERSMDAGGFGQQLAQSSEGRASTFQMALTLGGIGSHLTQDRSGRWIVTLLKTTRIAPITASQLKRSEGTPRRFVAEWIEHSGPVWCPRTPNGTWLARRAGTVYFTGNSYGMGCDEAAIAAALRPFCGSGIVELFHAPTNIWYPVNVGAHEDHIHAAIAENFRFPA
jgi:hypothetical protein